MSFTLHYIKITFSQIELINVMHIVVHFFQYYLYIQLYS